ncbi:nitrite/sulfite reductase [Sulfurimonas sp.]|uniref:nitrite/sulfite reductase n=1 Tax=Sulfurimonas sp. TaxID=2022749 RepID=UPI0025F98339|nr:nitrite/sulfite reductase [Sulfurimonas sp.]MDD5156813.1 nitrite/sulfite reductase [Sulfurimonas sp.]
MIKETKAQRVERIKKAKDGLDVLNDIYRYAKSDEEIDMEDIDRFKWYGLYTQNRNLQDKDDLTQYFMLRVKLFEGELDLKQIEAVAYISDNYARKTADFTTRQDIQFHFIKIKDLPEIFAKLTKVNLRTVFAAGDVPRNVVTCPVDGINKEQIYGVKTIAKNINRYFDANPRLSNLPRKYKVSISGCNKYCTSHEIHDLSFNARETEDGEIFFDVSVGGGLASSRRIASYIGYVRPPQVLAVTKAVTEIYKKYGNRDDRNRARLGHLLDLWGVEKFIEILHKNIDFVLKKEDLQECTPYEKREHFGIHNSIEDGRSYIGCSVVGGRIGADGLYGLLELLKKYNATYIKLTTTQNFVIADVPTVNAPKMVKKLKKIGIEAYPSPFRARTLSCTGMNFCKFAISETKELAEKLIIYLEKRFPKFNEPISFSVNGCPNSCAHPNIVDVGLLGCKVEENGKFVSGFELILGGYLEGEKSNFGRKTGIKFIPDDALRIVEELIKDYIKSDYKNFHSYAIGRTTHG